MVRSLSPLDDVSTIGRHPNLLPHWLRRCVLAVTALFAWTMVLATPLAALTHQPPKSRLGLRTLTPAEMQRIVGRETHDPSYSSNSGPTYGWEGSFDGVNTGNGNKLTSIPIVSWTQIGGLPVALTLNHNSQSTHDSELGQKWTFSYDLYLVASGTSPYVNQIIHWGNDLSYQFTNNGSNVFSPPTGIHDSLVLNVDGSFTLTTKDQVAYHFLSNGYCNTISDENGNTITLTHNSDNYVTSITDATNRTITLGYDSSNRINSITDPLSRQWTIAYDSSNELQTLTYPVVTVGGTPTTYTTTFGYDAYHDITSWKSPDGNTRTYNYNSDCSLNWEKDAVGNQTGITYTSGTTATITDPNGHTRIDTYTSGTLTQQTDALSNSTSYEYDTNLDKKQVVDFRGNVWLYTFDGNGNMLTSEDPLLDVVTTTYNTHNKLLTVTLPTGESTVYTYDTTDNLLTTQHENATGTVEATYSYTVNTYGLRTDYYDANNHHYHYGYSANGNLTSQTTPLGNETQWTVDALGFRTSRTDAMSRTTDYTPDGWERLVTITYPDTSTKTYAYSGDNCTTGFTDVSGTTTRTFDADDRLPSESKGGSTIVSHTYDATGKLGLLSTTTDANGRVLTYSYTARNQLYQVSETAGTTTYSYDANGSETGITNPNATTVTKAYDDDEQLTSVVNKTSGGTTLSSFSYVLDTDGRRHTVTEVDGSVDTYSYDWGSRLTSEVRTGTNAYSYSYTLDPVGNRTAETLGTATTNFTLDSDDQLNSTSSSTGGFTNSYSYDANGEQTGRTLGSTAYTLAFDFDGELTSITQGSAVVSFTYDALGRRVSRTSGGTTTDFLYDGDQILLEQQGSTTSATYTYGNGLIRKDGETPLFDGLGSERTVTNSSQTVTGTATYEGFGQTIATTGSSTDPYMFAATSGYRNDGDAGLMHVGARYYDAQVGRFISRDTFLDQKPYLYCEHDPVNNLDPTGHLFNIGKGIQLIKGVLSFLSNLGGFPVGGPAEPEAPPTPPAVPPGIYAPPPPGWNPNGPPPPFPIEARPVGRGGEGDIPPAESGGAGGCFVAGTLVSLANGDVRPIEDIKVGDRVLSRDDQTGETKGQVVEKVFIHNTHDRVIVRLCNQEQIETTRNHRFYIVDVGWLHAGQLRCGMRCITNTGSPVVITGIDLPFQSNHPVYNLCVRQFHTYFVGKTHVWVHNMSDMGSVMPEYSAY